MPKASTDSDTCRNDSKTNRENRENHSRNNPEYQHKNFFFSNCLTLIVSFILVVKWQLQLAVNFSACMKC
jgi:hypothetical protein